jgi:hypothetical protein
MASAGLHAKIYNASGGKRSKRRRRVLLPPDIVKRLLFDFIGMPVSIALGMAMRYSCSAWSVLQYGTKTDPVSGKVEKKPYASFHSVSHNESVHKLHIVL